MNMDQLLQLARNMQIDLPTRNAMHKEDEQMYTVTEYFIRTSRNNQNEDFTDADFVFKYYDDLISSYINTDSDELNDLIEQFRTTYKDENIIRIRDLGRIFFHIFNLEPSDELTEGDIEEVLNSGRLLPIPGRFIEDKVDNIKLYCAGIIPFHLRDPEDEVFTTYQGYSDTFSNYITPIIRKVLDMNVSGQYDNLIKSDLFESLSHIDDDIFELATDMLHLLIFEIDDNIQFTVKPIKEIMADLIKNDFYNYCPDEFEIDKKLVYKSFKDNYPEIDILNPFEIQDVCEQASVFSNLYLAHILHTVYWKTELHMSE